MNDINGKELSLGDRVAFNPPHYKGLVPKFAKGLVLGTVVGFSPKQVKIEYELSWRPRKPISHAHTYPHDVAIVEKGPQNEPL